MRRHTHIHIHIPISISIYLYIYISISLSIYLYLYLYIYIYSWIKNVYLLLGLVPRRRARRHQRVLFGVACKPNVRNRWITWPLRGFIFWLYLDAEVLVLPPVFLPQDSVFVGRRLRRHPNTARYHQSKDLLRRFLWLMNTLMCSD